MSSPALALLWMVLLAPVPDTPGQEASGEIHGTITDSSGAVLVGATVELTGPVGRTETTGPDGRYRCAALPPGVYTVTAKRSGFKTVARDGVEVAAGTAVEVSLTLPVEVPGVVLVVTATKVGSALVDAPATMSVIGADALTTAPVQDYGDLLRAVPGLNVIQMSAREIDLTGRQASATLANTELALVDGRTVYADFFGLVFWDLIPVATADIKQIEVVRGPASAVWGANAATGVVNIITKTPREATGSTLVLSGGGFSRDAGDTAGEGVGGLFGASLSLARAPNDRWSYRVSAGFFGSDPLPRPSGTIPSARDPLDPTIEVGGGTYQDTSFVNQGTKQPKLDVRVDQELGGGGSLSYSAGFAGSRGIIHTPIGPFDMQSGSYLGYGRVAYSRGAFRLAGFANLLDGKAPNLIARDETGQLLRVDFKNQTYDLEVLDSRVVGGRQVVTYGGNLRRNVFDISIAPDARDRTEYGAYVQDEVDLGRFRVALSARVDKLGNLADAFISPRAMVMYKPTPSHSVRVSFNRGFRAPSAIENFLDLTVLEGAFPLAAIDPSFGDQQFPIITHTVGSPDLKPESLKAYEAAYTGTFARRVTAGLAFYLNDTDDNITSDTSYYSSANPPPGWPLPPEILDQLALGGVQFPEEAVRVNRGRLRNKGVEASVQCSFEGGASAYANYSYQAVPSQRDAAGDPRRFPTDEIAIPPRNRFNAGISLSPRRYLVSASVSYADKAFWTDVLDSRFHGFTDAYTLVNASVGVKWRRGKVTTSVRATNLLNHDIQQHIFGDILKRSVVADVRVAF